MSQRFDLQPPQRGHRRARALRTGARALFGVALAMLLGPAPIVADGSIVIASGVAGRTYHDVYGVNLARLLPAFKVTQRATQGSGENLDLLADGIADIGFAQRDAYKLRLRADAERYGQIGIVGRLNDECLFVAYRKTGDVLDAAGLERPIGERKPLLSVGEMGSGTHETWRLISELEPAFGAAAVRFTAGTLAINHLAAGLLDAVAWVTDPTNPNHKLLRATLADKSLGVFGIADADIVSASEGVYRIQEVNIARRGDDAISTLCTSSILFTGAKARPRLVDVVSDVLSLHRAELLKRK